MKGCFALLLLLSMSVIPAWSFGRVALAQRSRESWRRTHCLESTQHNIIDRQSDDKYGRGVSHLSADLKEGDVIAYQGGTWYVDGTEVGDGSNSVVKYLLVDTIQLVWTHDCEHGMINGFDVTATKNMDVDSDSVNSLLEKGNRLVVSDDYVQIGPEQVLARIPTELSGEKWGNKVVILSQAMFDPKEEMLTS